MCFLLKKGISLKVNYFILCPVCQQEMARCPADSPVFTVSRGKISPGWALLPPAPQQKSPAAFHAQGSRARYFVSRGMSNQPALHHGDAGGRHVDHQAAQHRQQGQQAAPPPPAGASCRPAPGRAARGGTACGTGTRRRRPWRGTWPRRPSRGASPLDRGQQGENPRRHQADAHAHAPPRTWCSGRRPGGRRAPCPQRRRQGPAPRRGAPHRRRREGTSSSTYPSRQ